MSTITKLLLVPALVVAFSVGVAIAASGGGTSTPDPLRAGDTTTTVDNSVVDISGPCDEAEHANDPRCTGAGTVTVDDDDDDAAEDVSGPCDEAEHANDPRCTGAPAADDDDRGEGSNSGPGSASSGRSHDDDHGDDDSGHGSDHSGHGSDDDSGHDD